MASDKAGAVFALAGLLALAAVAGAVHDSPRLVVLCGLLALPFLIGFWHCLNNVAARSRLRVTTLAPSLTIEQKSLIDNAQALEARLEHAPIALFLVEPNLVTPLNTNARRLVAPGRASDPQDLYRQLLAQPVDQRSMIGFDTERGVERALVSMSALTLNGRSQRLAALMPVESELEAEAMQAWQQLVHVLTHEIMNSLTPVE